MNFTTITSDDEIEIKTDNIDSIINHFYIYLKNRNECIGSISYRGYHYNQHLGDLGCVIYMDYRKKGYAYKAFILMSQLLNKKGIPDFWITCNKNNIASLKLIIHHNEIIEQKFVTDDILLFRCKTKQKEQKNNRQIKRINI